MKKKINYIVVLLVTIFFSFFTKHHVQSQCLQNYNWTTWNSFVPNTANGTVLYNGLPIGVTMTSNFNFNSTGYIYGYGSFSGFPSIPSNTTVPATTWAIGTGGVTTMCFSQPVQNPVLLIASLGSSLEYVTIKFSKPYTVVYDGGGNTFVNDSMIIGFEGYSIIKFPGNFDCVTIYSNTTENWTNLTWGLNPPLFPVTITENYNTCGIANYTASGGTAYSWTGGLTPNQATNTFNSSGTYFLTVTDQNGCQVNTSQQVTVNQNVTNLFPTDTISACGSSYTLDAGAGYSNYQWNTGSSSQTIDATNSGWYYCTVTQGNCISNDSVFLSLVNSSINSVTQTVCDSLRWYGTLYVNSGTYTYTYTNANGCPSTDTLHLNVNRSTHFSVTQTICDSLRWNGMLYQSSEIYLYNYNNSAGCASTDTLHLTINSSTHQSESHEVCRYFIWHETVYRSSGIYFYRYINSESCPSVDTLYLTIHPGPDLGPDKNNKICYGTDFNLNSLFNLTAINIINWTLGNNSVLDPIHANQAGNYQLIVGDIFGCADTAMVNLSINPPVISNAGNDTIVQMNIPFQLHGSGGQTYIWSPASVLNNPFIAAPWGNIFGTTEFMLTTFDDIGCSDEDSVKVKALAGPQFYVPNAFTPNGDGLNDIFRPINVGIPTITEFCIFSRYGEKIFETSDLKKGWDGSYKGLKQPMSNYVWIVKGIDINNKSVQKKGNVLLIR
jgi:gliding motility-associated-like protein